MPEGGGSAAPTDPSLGEWGARTRPPLSRGALGALVMVAALGVLVPGALAWWVAGVVAGAAVALLCAVALMAWVAIQPRRALGARSPVPLGPEAAPRLMNLVAGLSADLGIPAPRVWIVEGEGANAVVGRLGDPSIGVTRALLDLYTRTELEAVVAHCLLRLRPPVLRREALAAALGPVGGPLCPVVDAQHDACVAAVTRYPPALASAVLKATPARAGAPFLFVAPPPWHDDPEKRAGHVADL